jgi:hypothetical protein
MAAEISAAAVPLSLALARHMPAPIAGSVFYRWIFDTIQDLAKNNDRIGETRAAQPQKETTTA